jgi:hypothetical protein
VEGIARQCEIIHMPTNHPFIHPSIHPPVSLWAHRLVNYRAHTMEPRNRRAGGHICAKLKLNAAKQCICNNPPSPTPSYQTPFSVLTAPPSRCLNSVAPPGWIPISTPKKSE